MKRKDIIIALIAFIMLPLPGYLYAQGTTIPLTTSSDEAREAFLTGRQKKENIQPEAAELLFDRAIELDPQFALAYIYRGNPGDHEKALENIDEVSDGEKLAINYFIASNRYDLKTARDYLDKLLMEYPSCKHVHLWAGLFYENILHNYQLALDHFYIATRLDEEYAAPHNELGYRLMRLGDFEKADIEFRKYIELAPECPNAYDSYANFLMKQKRYSESIRQYSELYDLNPEKIVTVARIGQNYAFMGDYDEARLYYTKYYNLSGSIGEKASALNLIAASYIAEGKMDDALLVINEYVDLGRNHNSNIDIILGTASLGFINLEAGNEEEGLDRYIEASRLLETLELPEPTHERYSFSSLGWLCRAYADNGNINRAEKYLTKARQVVEKTNNPLYRGDFYFIEGYLHLKKGNYLDAIGDLLLCDRDDPFIIYTLAEAYHLAGEPEDAQEILSLLDSWENFALDYSVARAKSQKMLANY